MMHYATILPIRTRSENNNTGKWQYHIGRAKKQRTLAKQWANLICPVEFPLTVVFTRHAPCKLDIGDNLNSSNKHLRDGLADAFGVNDNSDQYTWIYNQKRSKTYGVWIDIYTQGDKPNE